MEILKDFGVEPILLLAQIVNFVILLYILKRFLYKPILKVLDERKKRIETSMNQSAEIQKKFEEVSQKQQEILDEAKKESTRIIGTAKNEAKILTNQIQTEANTQAEEIMKRNQQSLQLEKQKMISEAKQELIDVVASATERVVERSLTKADKDRLVKKSVAEIEK
ncbi:MAG: ATP synthase F0 subunit B [Candidatus Woykebacteria bacterium RBG_19FT_COMBO_43_10]|uniref:ATP synthase subunit b n=1 Tax=Candidatus Woykebacteria bacterium RBG_19FT_COMBO_43_10 TaxID=1802598 RepID=A0A1G1WKR1_9BACT|nr:MAG: ATP synthase F0 subunit B [Candidatus Woykebacteria bacterium RBG_19FT_COMBO_43_10]